MEERYTNIHTQANGGHRSILHEDIFACPVHSEHIAQLSQPNITMHDFL